VQRLRRRLAAVVKALHGANAEAVITTLNPVIRGWAAYYRTVVSKEIFNDLDHYMWVLTYPVGAAGAPEQGQTVGRGTLLRRVPPQKDRPVGVR
jgi:RNA-directed DNA polymerase